MRWIGTRVGPCRVDFPVEMSRVITRVGGRLSVAPPSKTNSSGRLLPRCEVPKLLVALAGCPGLAAAVCGQALLLVVLMCLN